MIRPVYECDNCGAQNTQADLDPIEDLLQRVDPGERLPGGECPDCGCLCHLVVADVLHLQAECYKKFLMGTKQLCILERRKDSDTFQRAIREYEGYGGGYGTYHLHLWHSPEGIEVVLAHSYKAIYEYLGILLDEDQWRRFPDKMRGKLGRLFGYSTEAIKKFIRDWTPSVCNCSKCIGIQRSLTAQHKAERLADRFTGSLRSEDRSNYEKRT